jgi:AraC family transcriptional regulator of adaptative response/methylated-DNA-[protein]-cysteine methyltransferase
MQTETKAATYGRNGKGARIGFFAAPCAFGYLMVAATEQGLCSVALGDSSETLEASLRKEFPAATIERDEESLRPYTQMLLRHIAGLQPELDLPLDTHGTEFQRQVWQALRDIPYGETRTYTQVAQAIGRPQSVRAVARACATNSLALVVPCHRVLRKDSSQSGYRWVLERKHRLLQHEAGNAQRHSAQDQGKHR